MFEKVLIAEDHESTNISVQKTLGDLAITQYDYVYYCDDALLRISKSVSTQQPYQLLITDISFEEDHREQKIKNGIELIMKVKAVDPTIKVLVFSAEDRPNIIEGLFKEQGIDAYVRKARHDAKELKLAIETISKGKKHLANQLRQGVKEKNLHEFTTLDITILTLLSQGVLQKDIPLYLQKNNIKPSGLSTIEKRLCHMKEMLDFSKNEQLIVFCKDLGII